MKKIFIALAIVVALLCFVSCSELEDIFSSTVEISTVDELIEFRDRVNAGYTYRGKTITLTADIDLKDEEWEPIGRYDETDPTYDCAFSGTFNGGDHTISNMKIKDMNGMALFGRVKNGTVKNLTVKGIITGSVQPESDGTYKTNTRNSAGIVAYTTGNVTIENCTSEVGITITNDSACKVGGIVAKNDGNLTLTRCTNKGNISSSGCYTGGIIADIEGIPVRDENGDLVKVGEYKAYYPKLTTIKKCANNGTITQSSKAEGIGPIAGHICKNANVSYMSDCTNTGSIVGKGTTLTIGSYLIDKRTSGITNGFKNIAMTISNVAGTVMLVDADNWAETTIFDPSTVK